MVEETDLLCSLNVEISVRVQVTLMDEVESSLKIGMVFAVLGISEVIDDVGPVWAIVDVWVARARIVSLVASGGIDLVQA